ncbi:hypothetical protein D3C87_1723160 [compost metagenome]
MYVLHRLAGGHGIDVEIVRWRPRRGLHDLVRIVDRPVIGEAPAPPVLVPNAQLEAGIGLPEKLELVDAEMLQQHPECRRGGLAHPHRRDL